MGFQLSWVRLLGVHAHRDSGHLLGGWGVSRQSFTSSRHQDLCVNHHHRTHTRRHTDQTDSNEWWRSSRASSDTDDQRSTYFGQRPRFDGGDEQLGFVEISRVRVPTR